MDCAKNIFLARSMICVTRDAKSACRNGNFFEKRSGKVFLNHTQRDKKEKAPNLGRFFCEPAETPALGG
jgi:hypothetical protein